MIKKTFVFICHFHCTKIQLLFEPAIVFPNNFPNSIFFLINQITYLVRKTAFPIRILPKALQKWQIKTNVYAAIIQ